MTANDVDSGFRRAGQIAVVSAEVQQVAWLRLGSQIAGAPFALELVTDAERGGTGVLVVPGSRTP